MKMLRIIPRLDIKNETVVKGIHLIKNFLEIV